MLRSLESSLQRLGLDRVDVVYLHDPDDFGDQAVREAIPALIAPAELWPALVAAGLLPDDVPLPGETAAQSER